MFDCVVIGAGPGGLACTKELLEQGITNILCLEKTDKIGGVFNHAYDHLVLTSSCTFSMFSDFWIGDGKQHDFWTKEEVLDYWSRYAHHFNLFDKIRFNSQVVGVEPVPKDDTWQVKLSSGEIFATKRIVLVIGNNSVPNYPVWKDLLTDIDYSHSKEFSNGDKFAGKNVLVVGGGESASDVALGISQTAKNCWVSLRSSTGWVLPRKRDEFALDITTHRGIYGLPREYGGVISPLINEFEKSHDNPVNDAAVELNKRVQAKNGIWGTYGTKTFSLPKAIANHGCKIVSEIKTVEQGGKKLTTADGETLNVDAVVFCTGYKNVVSFLPEQLQKSDPRSLYKHMFHKKYGDKLVWIGSARPCLGSQFPIMEIQSRYFALICNGLKALPNEQKMKQAIEKDKRHYINQLEHNAKRVRSLVDYHHYMDDIADLIGCKPPLWRYFFLHPRLWIRMVFGATQATQFRLTGLGSKTTLAQQFISKLPISRFNYIVKAGLTGRINYTTKYLLKLFNFLPSQILLKFSSHKN